MSPVPDPPIRVEPVVDRAGLDAFIDLPWGLYRDDPDWVPPLKRDMRTAFDPSKHPFHRHSEAQPFLALRGGEPVGRICAIRNRNHEAFHREAVGFFGFFESVDDAGVAAALLDTAREWLRERGLAVMRGPTSFSTNEVTGLFVEGADGPPVVMMAYNPPYYPRLLEGYGFGKARDLYAWMVASSDPDYPGAEPEYLVRAEKIVRRRLDVRVRPIEMARFGEELESVRALYNAAWEDNWSFVPMTDDEFDFMAAELKPIVEPSLALFVDNAAGDPIAFALAVPDFNYVLKRLDGKLFPFGIVKALYHRRKIETMRVLILGVLEEHRGKGIDALLYLALFRNGTELGITRAELSWILEDNQKMNQAIERMGGRVYRTYRLYDVEI